jgi:hypothetical protein
MVERQARAHGESTIDWSQGVTAAQ